MLSYDQATVRREEKNSNWLYSQVHQACTSLLKKPLSRRGPFLIDEETLLAMQSDTGSIDQLRSTSEKTAISCDQRTQTKSP